MIADYLNKLNSTRNLSDEQFLSILDQLALELSETDYSFSYSEEDLRYDWKKLKRFGTNDKTIPAGKREGMRLIEHFMTNFHETEDAKGRSVAKLWKDPEFLKKVWSWNRKAHTTPYISELKRGVYFCSGMPKVTMYRPTQMKNVCDWFEPKVVLDPCAGWGGRMLGACSRKGTKYYSFEPNTKTFGNLMRIKEFLKLESAQIWNCGAEDMLDYVKEPVDLILTSPPYFNVEVYTKEETQSISKHDTYAAWRDLWLKDVISKAISLLSEDGVSCWNVAKFGKFDLVQDVINIHSELGFVQIDSFGVSNSVRPGVKKDKPKINIDTTMVFKKVKS